MRTPTPEELGAREAIRAVLAAYARGVDRRDWDLVRRCYHPGATDHHGVVVGTVDDLVEHMAAALPYAGTAHYELDARIELEDDVAYVESSSIAFHWHAPGTDGRDLWMAVRYLDRFECRDGDWRIANRRTVLDWAREADTREEEWPLARHFLRGRPGPDDPSYVTLDPETAT